MSKITELGDFTNIDDPKEFMRFASRFISQLQDTVNGGLDFSSNVNCQIVDISFPSLANQEFAVTHTLNRTGLNFIVISKNVSCDVYRGSTIDTKSVVYLKCTVATASVRVILI